MTIDILPQIRLQTFFHGALAIIAAGNLGYFMANTLAESGFLFGAHDRIGRSAGARVDEPYGDIPMAGIRHPGLTRLAAPVRRARRCVGKWRTLAVSAIGPALGDERDSASACGRTTGAVTLPTCSATRRWHRDDRPGSRPSSPRARSRGSSGWLGGSKAASARETPSRCQRRSRGGTPRRKTGHPDPSPPEEWMHPGIGRAPSEQTRLLLRPANHEGIGGSAISEEHGEPDDSDREATSQTEASITLPSRAIQERRNKPRRPKLPIRRHF